MNFGIVEHLRSLTGSVIVLFTGGRHSSVLLDLCVERFVRVEAVYLEFLPLEFRRKQLAEVEARYGMKIRRVVWDRDLAAYLRMPRGRQMEEMELFNARAFDRVRRETGVWWICSGQRACDSELRKRRLGSEGMNAAAGIAWPLAVWSDADEAKYSERWKLIVAPDYQFSRQSLDWPTRRIIAIVQERFPGELEGLKLAHSPPMARGTQ
jgi:3'-phosphoadenosine 5'-phosphosulfate sulfotransferase (PAPS reductase)/FAD synthetase